VSERDLITIEHLRRRDEAAARAGDFATLRSLVSDDAVIIPPEGAIVSGKAAIDRHFAAAATTAPYTVIDYNLNFAAPEIIGDLAIEFGIIEGATRDRADGTVRHATYNALRILRREAADWRVYRTIWVPAKVA
jgi:ketosteroid isomerase-like protein